MRILASRSKGWLLACSLACLTGCTAAGDRPAAAWLRLPSPWASVKESAPGRESAGQARQSSTASRAPGMSGKDESVAMALLRGRNHERAGEWDKARKLYEELRDRDPGNPQVAHRLGVVADAERRHEEAEHYFLAALQQEPRNAELLADLGYCYFLQGQLTKAESAATKAVLLEPGNSRYRNNLGLILGHLGRYDEALAHFRKSGSEADAHYNLAFVYAAQERVEDALACFEAALNADPTHRQAREALASFREFEERPEHLRDVELVEDDGNWVPFQENSTEADGGEVIQASAAGPVTSRDASRTTRALHAESRGMLDRNMQAQRNAAP